MEQLLPLGVIIFAGLLLLLFTRLRRARGALALRLALRPLASFNALEGQVGRAVESGSRLHITLGQASLIGVATPTSVAALTMLDSMAKDGCANGTPPIVTVGEGTLLPAAQGSLYHAYSQAQRTVDFEPGAAQFIASERDPFAYAGGVTNVIQQNKIISNVMVGRFGAEIALMAAAANRAHIDQIIGTDNPTALAVATPVTDNLLIGEELLATGAYLEGKPNQVASLQAQDILRLLIILAMVGLAAYQLAGNL